jgi:hypothetical protein
MSRAVRLVIIAMLLIVGGSPITSANVPWAPHRVMVMVFPTDEPGHRYELAIGSTAFVVRSGRRGVSAMVMSDASQAVSLRTIPGCRLIAHFTATSGHLYAIALTSPTEASVSEAFGDTETPLRAESDARCVLPPTDALPATTQSPAPAPTDRAEPFPIYGLGRIGYALPSWIRAAWNGPFAFIAPSTDIDVADYRIVVPSPGGTLDERVGRLVEELRGDMSHATEPVVATLDAPSGPVGRVTRQLLGVPSGIEGHYLWATCPDGTALEATFTQPSTADEAATTALAAWDDIAAMVVPCHEDVRIVLDHDPVIGDAALLAELLRDWTHRQVGQWAAFRDLVTKGDPALKPYLTRAGAIRDEIARIDRDERARLARLYPEPFARPVMIVAAATAGLDVPAMIDRLGRPRSRADVEAMEQAAEAGFALWIGAIQEAYRSLGLGDPDPFPRASS